MALSKNTVQKTFRQELLNVHCRFIAVNGVGATQTLVTANGVSKGVSSVISNGSGLYTLVLGADVGPIKTFVGKIIDITFENNVGANAFSYNIVSATPATRTIVFQTRLSSTSAGGIAAGARANIQITLSKSPVVF